MPGLFDDLIPQKPQQGPPLLRPFRPGEQRPNPDGSVSTEITTTWQMPDGQWANVPSLWMGPQEPVQFDAGDEEGIMRAMRDYESGGAQFPRFPTVDAATSAAQARSNAGGAAAGRPGLFDDLIPKPSAQPTIEDFQRGTGAFSEPPAMAAPAAPNSVPPGQPGLLDQLGRAFQVNMQGVGRGAAGIAGLPFDMAGLGVDLGLAGVEKGVNLFRDNPVELPRLGQMPMGRQHLIDSASNIMRGIGIEPIERQDMNQSERFSGDVLEFGTEAGAVGAALANRAAARFPGGQTKGVVPAIGDAFLAPYIGQGAPSAIVRDVAAGMGSGVGANVAEENMPESDLAKAVAMILGGIGGATLMDVPGAAARVGRTTSGFMPATDIPYEAGSATPVARRVVENTRNFLEDKLTDPRLARDRVAQRVDDAKQFGEPMPTTGIASDDIGAISIERGLRTREETPFQEADQRLKDAAQEKITGLRDPMADQSKAKTFAEQRPEQLAADRDAAALPLLRQAEQRGVAVDAKPVADLIDGMLAKDKRPAVTSALKQARQMLNAAGSDQLDTSVSGLYETRKAINDIIEGRTDSPTGRYATRELVQVRDALDAQINAVAPEFGQYLQTYRSASRPLDVFKDSEAVKRLMSEGDPRDVAESIFSGSRWGGKDEFKQINEALAGDPEATRAWKAAVADVLVRRVTNTNTALTGGADDGPASVAKLQQLVRTHEDELAQVFSPAEMNTIQRSRKMLEPLGNLARKATPGSPTASNQQLANAFEAAVLAYTGNAIKTGMIMKRLKVAMSMVPGLKELTLEAQTGRFVKRVMLDPELFVHVMDTPLRQMESPAWNAKLNRLLAGAEYVRGSDEEKQ